MWWSSHALLLIPMCSSVFPLPGVSSSSVSRSLHLCVFVCLGVASVYSGCLSTCTPGNPQDLQYLYPDSSLQFLPDYSVPHVVTALGLTLHSSEGSLVCFFKLWLTFVCLCSRSTASRAFSLFHPSHLLSAILLATLLSLPAQSAISSLDNSYPCSINPCFLNPHLSLSPLCFWVVFKLEHNNFWMNR